MKKLTALLLAITFAICLITPCTNAQVEFKSNSIDYSLVKARLTSLGDQLQTLDIKLTGDYCIKETGERYSDCTLTLKLIDGVIKLYKNNSLRALSFELNICRKNQIKTAGFVTIGKKSYLGDFRFRIVDNSDGNSYMQVINHVPMAYYLYGVVEGELGEGQPIEALKAQAIASKCYAIMSMKAGSNYDIGDTSATQVYKGYDPSWTNIMRAVDSSVSEAVMYNGKIIKTYYAASNGGETSLPADVWNGDASANTGYSQRIDNADFSSSAPKETLSLKLGQPIENAKLDALLTTYAKTKIQQDSISIKSLNYCELNTPRYEGSLRNMTNAHFELTVKTETNECDINIDMPVKELYNAGIFTKSTLRMYWGGMKGQDTYEIYHVRFGHGVGLSQDAAIYRAKNGQDHKEILSFYYPGTTIGHIDISMPEDKPVSTDHYGDSIVHGDMNADIRVNNHAYERSNAIMNTVSEANPLLKLKANTHEVHCYAYVIRAGAELYSSPDGSGVVINRLAYGDILTVLKNDAGYMHVETATSMIGYIKSSDVQIIDKAGSTFTYRLGYVNSESLNLREKPSTSSTIYARLSKNTALYIWGTAGTNNDWYLVQWGLTYGYVSAQYVDVKNTYTANNVIIGSVIASGITKSSVNLRPEASTSNTPITTLSGGTYLLIYSYQNSWYKVQANGIQGYLRDDYVTVNTAIPIPPANVEQPLDPQPIGVGKINASNVRFRSEPNTQSTIIELLQKGDMLTLYSLENNWYYAKHNGKMGYVSAQYIDAESYSAPSAPETELKLASGKATASVNFRSGASTSDSIYSTLPVNTAFEVIGKCDDWYFIRYGGKTGYVSKKYATVTNDGNVELITVAKNWQSHKATTINEVNLRLGPGITYSVIRKLSSGTSLTVLAITSDWCLVDVSGTLGYVSQQYLKK